MAAGRFLHMPAQPNCYLNLRVTRLAAQLLALCTSCHGTNQPVACNGCSQAMGLHCSSVSVDVGNTVLTVSSALLSAMNMLAAISKHSKTSHTAGAVKHSKPRSKELTAAAFDKIVASLPDQVRTAVFCVSLCLLTVVGSVKCVNA